MRYRIGLELGTDYIGWAVVRLMPDDTPRQLVRLGVRVFADTPRLVKDRQPNALVQRELRQRLRRRERYLQRRSRFMEALIRHGLLPQDAAQRKALVRLDPYELRVRGLDEPLDLYHLGRALFHLNQRRGLQARGMARGDSCREAVMIQVEGEETEAALREAGARTLGEWLWMCRRQNRPIRPRRSGQTDKSGLVLPISHALVAAEFDTLWVAQRSFHGEALSDAARDELRDILLFHRGLKPAQPVRCCLEPEDLCAPLALPSVQRLRIYQDLNRLRIVGEHQEPIPLTRAQRDRIAHDLLRGRKRSFEQITRLLRLPSTTRFNLQSERRMELKGDATAAILGRDEAFGERWYELSLAEQDALVQRLLKEPSEAVLVAELMNRWGLPYANAQRVARLKLPEGHGPLGRRALARVLPVLERDIVDYDRAVVMAGYAPPAAPSQRLDLDELPYYGRVLTGLVRGQQANARDEVEQYGRLASPTVHVVLNQLRGLVNALIRRYGKPEQVCVCVARELRHGPSAHGNSEQRRHEQQIETERYRQVLTGLGLTDTAENRKRLRLWEELNPDDPSGRYCVFTGEQISLSRLFSEEVEIGHLLPFARTLDDSMANQIVCLRRANRYKGNRTPAEAFAASPDGYDWSAILTRAARLPANKQWRFAADALQRLLEGEDFIARQLDDKTHVARIIKQYLECLYPEDGKAHVWITQGWLTGLMRAKWGLHRHLADGEGQRRTDYRHHAIDAAITAVTDQVLLQRMAEAALRCGEAACNRSLAEWPLPWEGFSRDVTRAAKILWVSHRPDHGVRHPFRGETARGPTGRAQQGSSVSVHCVPITALNGPEAFDTIRDHALREELHACLGHLRGEAFKAALARWSEQTGIRRVRCLPAPAADPAGKGRPTTSTLSVHNHAIEIWRDDQGVWRSDVITASEARQLLHRGLYPLPKETALNGKPLVMRLCKNDLVLIEEQGVKRLLRVIKIGQNGKITFADHYEGGDLKARDADRTDPFRYLVKNAALLASLRARRVTVDFLGILHDPGFEGSARRCGSSDERAGLARACFESASPYR